MLSYVHIFEDESYDPAACTFCDLGIAHTDREHDEEVSANARQLLDALMVNAEEE